MQIVYGESKMDGNTHHGSIISQDNARTLAHELGHKAGQYHIYDQESKVSNTSENKDNLFNSRENPNEVNQRESKKKKEIFLKIYLIRNMKNLIILILYLLIISCKEKINSLTPPINQDSVITMSSVSNYDSIAKLVKTKGDTLAYSELFYFLKDSNKRDRTDTLMHYSKIMAEKFNNEQAYLDYFKALCEKYDIEVNFGDYSSIDISLMDKSSKQKAKSWLNKMLEKKIISKDQFDSIKK
ncbi:hypothetical protein [Chryseobacterium sp. ON_d1]|uniref:hypothetical protein n=1 Tax=Chryseobacterium sp. ON_d1 TaxID=2583211 RepID=UPI00115908F0|nr:hypothetical protein [Chryseobacterium sp. ON_d1]GEJ48141.1 hypothetical protein CRS_47500 [Chryseobacterium sp. ON_d1]